MKKRLLLNPIIMIIPAIVLSLSITAWGEDKGIKSGGINESEVLATVQKWAFAISQADIGALDEILHNDYLHIHGTALVESKNKFIDALKTGARKYDPFKIEDANVRVFGDTAVVTGKFILRATTREKVIEGVNRIGLVLVNTPRGIQVASFQATSIPQAK